MARRPLPGSELLKQHLLEHGLTDRIGVLGERYGVTYATAHTILYRLREDHEIKGYVKMGRPRKDESTSKTLQNAPSTAFDPNMAPRTGEGCAKRRTGRMSRARYPVTGKTWSQERVQAIVAWARHPIESVNALAARIGVGRSSIWSWLHMHADEHRLDLALAEMCSRAISRGASMDIVRDIPRCIARWGDGYGSFSVPYSVYEVMERRIAEDGRGYAVGSLVDLCPEPTSDQVIRRLIEVLEAEMYLPDGPPILEHSVARSRTLRRIMHPWALEEIGQFGVSRVRNHERHSDDYLDEVRRHPDLQAMLREHAQRRAAALSELEGMTEEEMRRNIHAADRHMLPRSLVLRAAGCSLLWDPVQRMAERDGSAPRRYTGGGSKKPRLYEPGATLAAMRARRAKAAHADQQPEVMDVLAALRDGMTEEHVRRWRQAFERRWGWEPGTFRRSER